MSGPEFTTAQLLAAFSGELAALGFSENERVPLLTEALRHELPGAGLTVDGDYIPRIPDAE